MRPQLHRRPVRGAAAPLAHLPARVRPALPPFQGGAVGYFGYDLAHHLERLPLRARTTWRFPDLALGFYDVVVAFDLLDRRAWLLSSGLPEPDAEARMRRRAAARLEAIAARLGRAAAPGAAGVAAEPARDRLQLQPRGLRGGGAAGGRLHPGRRHLPGQPLAALPAPRCPPAIDALDLYRRLRGRNPAPFAAYLDLGDVAIASASPERFLRLARRPGRDPADQGHAAARRHAGRGRARWPTSCWPSEKDRAENVMIVDLLRNDLSRVCRDRQRARCPSSAGSRASPPCITWSRPSTGELRPGSMRSICCAPPSPAARSPARRRSARWRSSPSSSRRGAAPYCGAIG